MSVTPRYPGPHDPTSARRLEITAESAARSAATDDVAVLPSSSMGSDKSVSAERVQEIRRRAAALEQLRPRTKMMGNVHGTTTRATKTQPVGSIVQIPETPLHVRMDTRDRDHRHHHPHQLPPPSPSSPITTVITILTNYHRHHHPHQLPPPSPSSPITTAILTNNHRHHHPQQLPPPSPSSNYHRHHHPHRLLLLLVCVCLLLLCVYLLLVCVNFACF
jgi:hypothetical protein